MPSKPHRLESRRIALHRKVVMRVPGEPGLITGFCTNLSMTGMFVRTDLPRPPATVLSFEFRLVDGAEAVRGTGLVTWIRATEEGADRPPGMGLQFLELAPSHRRLLRRIVVKQMPEGDGAAVLAGLRSDLSAALDGGAAPGLRGDLPLEAIEPPAVVAGGDRRRWSPMAALGLVLALAALIAGARFLGVFGGGRDRAAGGAVTASAPVSATAGGPAAVAPTSATAAAASLGAGETTALPMTEAAITEAVRAWAQAWSDQRVDDYLAHYSRAFEPPDGLGRAAWETERRERIAAPSFVRVAIAALDAEPLAPGTARATFFQTYRSDRFQDTVRKTLELVWEEGAWKIRRELAED